VAVAAVVAVDCMVLNPGSRRDDDQFWLMLGGFDSSVNEGKCLKLQ